MPVSAESALPSLPTEIRAIEVNARALARFQPSDAQRRRFGKLEFRGGLVMSSSEKAFGGWSGMVIDPDGRRFLATSDEGAWMSGEIVYRGRTPVGISGARLGPILALKGRRIERKRDLDAEAMALVDGNLAKGNVLIGFEHNHRIGVFPVSNGVIGAPVRYLPLNAEFRRMRANKGLEAVTQLKGGPHKRSVIAFAERYPGDASRHTGWIWIKNEPKRLALTDIGGFEITDAAALDDGGLLVLERRFRWTEGVKMRLRRIAASDIRPGATLAGEVLLEADMAYEIDNMEGLAVHRGPSGEMVITLLSDDNFNAFLQRNLLLQFTLVDETAAQAKR